MAIDPTGCHFYYSGGANNTLGSLSFGDVRGQNQGDANKTWDAIGTLTSAQGADLRIVVDTATIGDGTDAHVGKAIMIASGAAIHDAARVIAFDTATGVFILEEPLSSAAGSGDTYHLYAVDSMIDDVDAADCAAGQTDYRCMYWRNESGIQAQKIYFFYRILGTGSAPVDVEVFAKRSPATNETSQADDEQGPPASQLAVEHGGFVDATQRFGLFATPNRPWRDVTTNQPLASNNTHRAVWLKRTVKPNTRRNEFVIVQLTAEYRSADDSAIVSNSMLFAFVLDGFTPQIDLQPDRGPTLTQQQLDDGYDAAIRIGHGARMTATVLAQETGLPVPDLEIGWELDGPGELFVPTVGLTDSAGISRTTYAAPGAATATRKAVAFDGFGALTAADGASSVSCNHTIGSGTERVLLVFSAAASGDDPPADLEPYQRLTQSVTYGGDPLVRVAQVLSARGARVDVWRMIDPPSGAAQIEVTHPLVVEALSCISVSFANVDQFNPFDVAPVVKVVDDDAATVWSDSIATVTAGAELFMMVMPFHPNDITVTTDAPAMFRLLAGVGLSPAVSFPYFATQTAATPGVQTQSFSGISTGSDRLGVLLALRPTLTAATVTAKV